jgi:predicted TIM-barrel fold metal-dependent hydrolase
MHVFGPPERYPAAPNRTYQTSEKGFADYQEMADRLGIERVVIVQPSAYGTDNRCTLDALRTRGAATRAVVVVDPTIADDELTAMDRLGVRGVRLNLMSPRIEDPATAADALDAVAARIERLGWHIQIYADLDLVTVLAPAVRQARVPVVFDHMAGAKATGSADDPRFQLLLDLLAAGRCWVKLSGADIVTWENRDFSGASPFAQALIAANSRQLVWGTDWPHLVHHASGLGDAAPPAGYRPVDEEALFASLRGWAGDEATARAILVDNPARLYRF